MARTRFLHRLFSSGLQTVSVQVLGLVFFYLISFYATKEDFGIINWSMAVCALLTTLLSFGMEQVVFRRIASARRSSDWAAMAFLLHSAVGTVLVLLGLILIAKLSGSPNLEYLPWFFAAQGLTYLGLPLRQFLNAKQRFTPYGVIAVLSNLVKMGLAFWVIRSALVTVTAVYYILIVCAAGELIALWAYVFHHWKPRWKFKFKAYKKLVKESLPQYMSVLFDSGLSRIDWILLGIMGTQIMTAEYAFAYRAFEVAKMPILILAPILLAHFSRLLVGGQRLSEEKKGQIKDLFHLEVFSATAIALLANLIWVEAGELVFQDKYGRANQTEFMILSAILPVQFAINLLWTLAFTGKMYLRIANLTMGAAVLNILLNMTFIPVWGARGAALSIAVTACLQLVAYALITRHSSGILPLYRIVILWILGAGAYGLVKFGISIPLGVQVPLAMILFVMGALATRQVRVHQLRSCWSMLRR